MKGVDLKTRLLAWKDARMRAFRPHTGVLALERGGAVVGLVLLVIVFAALSAPFRPAACLICRVMYNLDKRG